MRASGCSARARPSCRRARRSLGRPAREQSLRPAGGRTPFARRPGTATRTALPFAIRTSEALSATPTHTDPRATVIARAPRIGMRRSTVEVSGRIRFTTFPFPATAQTASDVARMAPGQIPPRSSWILATVRPVSGEILETVESSWFATHSEPCPTAMPVGRPPTGIRRVTRFVPESMRSTSPARMSNAQTAPKPAASPTPPGWIRATIRFVSGSIRTISSRPREAQSDPDGRDQVRRGAVEPDRRDDPEPARLCCLPVRPLDARGRARGERGNGDSDRDCRAEDCAQCGLHFSLPTSFSFPESEDCAVGMCTVSVPLPRAPAKTPVLESPSTCHWARRDRTGTGLADVRLAAKDQHTGGDDDPPDARVRPAARAARSDRAVLRHREHHRRGAEPFDRPGAGVHQLEEAEIGDPVRHRHVALLKARLELLRVARRA